MRQYFRIADIVLSLGSHNGLVWGTDNSFRRFEVQADEQPATMRLRVDSGDTALPNEPGEWQLVFDSESRWQLERNQTRNQWKLVFRSSSVGSLPGCETESSSAWPT